MNTTCHICGCQVTLSIDEFFEIEQDIDTEFYCEDCADTIIEWVKIMQLTKN